MITLLPTPRPSGQRKQRGRALTTLAWIVLVAAVILAIIWFGAEPGSDFVTGFGGVLIVLLGLVAFSLLRMRARQHLAEIGPEALADDGRPPILFLRTFRDDSAGAVLNPLAGRARTIEEQICRVLSPIGPTVALGRPGEQLPALGAARVYVEEAQWQDTVRQYADRAPLVVLRVGPTENFWWEVEEMSRRLPAERVLFVVPDDDRQVAIFRERLGAQLSQTLPEFKPGYRIGWRHHRLRGILWFDAAWMPHWTPWKYPGFWRLNASEPVIPLLTNALQPIFTRMNVRWARPPVLNVWSVLMALLIGIIAILVLGTIAFG